MSGGLPPREVTVPEAGHGMRLDRFLARWFRDRSRSELARGIRDGLVTDSSGRSLRPSAAVSAGQTLWVRLPGIAASTPPPPLPPILHEDDRLVVLAKPAGLLCHPAGTEHVWAVIGLARERWPEIDLVHRLDRDTSGALVLSKDGAANAFLKRAFKTHAVGKRYDAITRAAPPWTTATLDGPIGPADGPIRIQMAVRDDGLAARTDVEVVRRCARTGRAWVRCRIHSGRTHQIRVHLAHAGCSIVGDRMYGVPPEVFLRAWEHGVDDETHIAAGAPRHALHATTVRFPHPDGGELTLNAPIPDDLQRWWDHPEVLPLDAPSPAQRSPVDTP
jgi:23S rRNA pseudouridine1911/1915/1917 synthase